MRAVAASKGGRGRRAERLRRVGYRPIYDVGPGWAWGTRTKNCGRLLPDEADRGPGFTHLKIKVGTEILGADDVPPVVRDHPRGKIGYGGTLMMEPNQLVGFVSAPGKSSTWRDPAKYKPWWIESHPGPDDVAGHAAILASAGGEKLGIGRGATGEIVPERVDVQSSSFCRPRGDAGFLPGGPKVAGFGGVKNEFALAGRSLLGGQVGKFPRV